MRENAKQEFAVHKACIKSHLTIYLLQLSDSKLLPLDAWQLICTITLLLAVFGRLLQQCGSIRSRLDTVVVLLLHMTGAVIKDGFRSFPLGPASLACSSS